MSRHPEACDLINLAIIWNVVVNDLPPLVKGLNDLLSPPAT